MDKNTQIVLFPWLRKQKLPPQLPEVRQPYGTVGSIFSSCVQIIYYSAAKLVHFVHNVVSICFKIPSYLFHHTENAPKEAKRSFLLPRCSRSLLTNHYSLLTINYSLLYWLQENFSSVRNIILIGEKLNSHQWENEFPSMGNRIPIGGTIVSHQWEFQFKPISCDRSTSWFVKN